MRVCVWIAIATALSGLGCGGATDNGALFDPIESGSSGAPGAPGSAGSSGVSVRRPSLSSAGAAPVAAGGSGSSAAGATGEAGAESETGVTSAAAGAPASAAGAPSGPECSGAFVQICPDVDGCLDAGKRECVGGKWSECACLDECKTGEARLCAIGDAEGLQLCGDGRRWSECYPEKSQDHALCHFPKSNPEHISPALPGDPVSTEYPECVLSCFFDGSGAHQEDKMRAKVAPLSSDHCVLQPADHCWRCP